MAGGAGGGGDGRRLAMAVLAIIDRNKKNFIELEDAMEGVRNLTIESLEKAVAGDTVAIRCLTTLDPAGGPGSKVFPPTYSTNDRELKYAVEERILDGQKVPVVLLDSVASQANRMEEALLSAWQRDELPFPVVGVDFSKESELEDLGNITTLHAPHRIADALFRDSVDENNVPFRDTDAGSAYTRSNVRNATAVYRYCPTALIFGVWDSTGPKGGLGAKFQRAVVSEIVGYHAVAGVKTASRIDPAGIQANVDVFHKQGAHDDWTVDPAQAEVKSGKPVPFSRKGAEGKGKPSAINHSNVAPSIDRLSGGVTISYAVQSSVISLPALRRLRFPADRPANASSGQEGQAIESAARTALAALAVAALVYQRAEGYDLRSRSLLLPRDPFRLEFLGGDGQPAECFTCSPEQAATLLKKAAKRADALGLGWNREPVKLKPSPKLADLIRRSRELAARGGDGDE